MTTNPPPPQKSRRELSEERILRFLRAFIDEHGFPPSRREIAEGSGIRSTSHVNKILKSLREQGAIAYEDKKPRTIRILEQLEQQLEE